MRQGILIPSDAQIVTYTVPVGPRRILKTINFDVTADATVGNRSMRIAHTDREGTRVFRVAASVVQAASTTKYYSFFPGASLSNSGSDVILTALPEVELREGDIIAIQDEEGVSAGDVIDFCSLVAEVFIE